MSSNPAAKAKTVKLTLDYPVEFEGASHTEVELRRMKGKDFRALEGMEEGTEKSFKLMQMLSGWPPEAFDDMDAADIEKVGVAIEGFIGKRRRR